MPTRTTCPPDAPRTGAASLARLDSSRADAELAAFAKAAAHPTRIKILRMLACRDAKMCCHIVDELPLAQSTVSEHLRILRSAGLIKANEERPRVGYCIVPSAFKRFKDLLNAV